MSFHLTKTCTTTADALVSLATAIKIVTQILQLPTEQNIQLYGDISSLYTSALSNLR